MLQQKEIVRGRNTRKERREGERERATPGRVLQTFVPWIVSEPRRGCTQQHRVLWEEPSCPRCLFTFPTHSSKPVSQLLVEPFVLTPPDVAKTLEIAVDEIDTNPVANHHNKRPKHAAHVFAHTATLHRALKTNSISHDAARRGCRLVCRSRLRESGDW